MDRRADWWTEFKVAVRRDGAPLDRRPRGAGLGGVLRRGRERGEDAGDERVRRDGDG
ncbi:hypothetical protein BE221DRAFT_192767, partial [Ostreococcus tauri]